MLLYKLQIMKILQKVSILMLKMPDYVRIYNVLGGTDYGPWGPYNITIPAGQTTFSFDVSIIDDDVLEGTEDFNLIILAESLPNNNITLGDPNRSTVTIIIVDDDSKSLVSEYISNLPKCSGIIRLYRTI